MPSPWSAGDVLSAADLNSALAAKVSSKILQVVNATYSTQVDSSSSAYADTGLTATITPTSATSKILVFVNQAGVAKTGANTGVQLKLLRGATLLVTFSALDAYTNDTSFNGAATASTTYLDSPATASAVTYKTQIASSANATRATVQGSSATSTITLMEVSA